MLQAIDPILNPLFQGLRLRSADVKTWSTCCMPEGERPDPISMTFQAADLLEGTAWLSQKEPHAVINIA